MQGLRKVGVDLDNHGSTSSYISRSRADAMVLAAQRNLGQGGIFAILGYNAPNEKDPRWTNFIHNVSADKTSTGNGVFLPQYDLLVLHGQEVKVAGEDGSRFDAHVIGHPPQENIPHGISARELCNFADHYNAFKGLAAPCHDKGGGRYVSTHPDISNRFTGVEVYSATAAASFFGRFPQANERAWQLLVQMQGHNPNLIPYVGTDGHSPGVIGRAHAVLSMPKDYRAFANDPHAVMSNLRSGYCNADPTKDFVMRPARRDAWMHALDLTVIIGAGKALKWDPNTQTAPFLEKLGIRI